MNTERYPIGTTVYYTLDDYFTGEPIIYSGTITDITVQDLYLNNKHLKCKFYKLDNGIGLMKNSFYTLHELFQLKERLEVTMNEFRKDKLLAQDGGTNAK